MLLARSAARLGACRGALGARRALFSGRRSDPPPQAVDEALRGVGQVVFCNSAGSGALILAALAVADPYLAAMATVGATSATAAARLGGLDPSSGLCGYNGTLVGCAFAVFLGTSAPVTLAATVAGAAATPFVGCAIAPLCGSSPPFTLAFNAVALSALALVRPFAAKSADVADVAAAAATGYTDLLLAPLTGVGQIFLVESPLSGALLLGAIGVYSPACALATLFGSSIGAGVGAAVDAPAADIAAGLWGFNPALTSLAVSVFFVPSTTALGVAAGASAATACLTGLAAPAFASALATPCLTVPFCMAAIGCHLVGGRVPGLVLAALPHSPEKNSAA